MEPENEVTEAQEQITPEPLAGLPENFKTVEALAASYKEAERKIHEQAAQLKKIEELEQRNREWEEWAMQQNQAQSARPEDQFIELWEDPDRQAHLALNLAQKVAQLESALAQQSQRGPDPTLTQIAAQYAENTVRSQHQDWDQYREQVAELVQQNPHLLGTAENSTPQEIARGLELAYWTVKGQSLASNQAQFATDATEAARIAKEQAQTMSGASSRPPTMSADQEYWERIRAAASGGYGS